VKKSSRALTPAFEESFSSGNDFVQPQFCNVTTVNGIFYNSQFSSLFRELCQRL